jgi:hypothetical protein
VVSLEKTNPIDGGDYAKQTQFIRSEYFVMRIAKTNLQNKANLTLLVDSGLFSAHLRLKKQTQSVGQAIRRDERLFPPHSTALKACSRLIALLRLFSIGSSFFPSLFSGFGIVVAVKAGKDGL